MPCDKVKIARYPDITVNHREVSAGSKVINLTSCLIELSS